MFNFLQAGEEVIFPCLPDIRLIVEEVNETNGKTRCKYYDDNLQKYIQLSLPAESLIPSKKKQVLRPRDNLNLNG